MTMEGVLPLVLMPPDSSLLYEGFFDPLLVTLSVAVAIFASYAALLVAQRVGVDHRTTTKRLWITVGGLCLGAGIWTMHFVGMLAFSLPCTTAYDPTITLLSMIPGILASTLAMASISQASLSPTRLAGNGLLLGAGIGTMHFSGMAAMRLDGLIRYNLTLFVWSILVAVALATLSLWTKFRLKSLPGRWNGWALGVSATVMGLAVSGMHYMAMAAAYFIRDGDPSIVASQITQTFLAAIVLAITCAIIVVTLVATFLARPAFLPFGKIFKLVGILATLWCAVAWLSSDYYSSRQETGAHQLASQTAGQMADDIADKIARELDAQQGMAMLLSQEEGVIKALRRFGPDMAPSPLPPQDRRRRWTQDRELFNLDGFLFAATTSLNADVAYLLNAAGDCVAASNADRPESFVGSNFADRDYFLQPLAGLPGRQYAMGRVSKIPGLFYSHPVFDDGRFVGVVVVKRDITGFLPWIVRAHAFVSDANGVIILADDKSLEYSTLPEAPLRHLTETETARQYGRTSFGRVDIQPWAGKTRPDVVRIGDRPQPLIVASRSLSDGAITVHLPRPLVELGRIEAERYWLFLLLAVAGTMLIATATAIVLYIRTTREAKNALQDQAAELVRSNADLARSNAELERFTEVLAHHLQEPVRQQHIFAQKLAKSLPAPVSKEVQESLGFILANATRLRSLIKGVETYLALDLPGHTSSKSCDVAGAFILARQDVQPRLDAIGANVTVAPLPSVPITCGRLVEVLQELMGNAIEYRHPDRPLRISLSAVRRDNEVILSVRDNGIGIPAEYRNRVFKVFERLHAAGEHEATGIGLAMVKKIVERAGGRIWIEDGDDGGTCVGLTLEVARDAKATS